MARILITSALPYINGVKHLGNLVGSILPSCAYARFMRQRGHETLFLCATDEHGTPAEIAAAKAGIPVADYCAQMYEVQKNLCEGFDISWDWFGRSSSAQNRRLTQHFAGKLDEAGLISEVETRQYYSPTDGRFLPDRYVEGTCPNCGYERARGDQCENCTKQLDPTDLIHPHSAISGATDLEIRETKHLYLRQSTMRGRLTEWIDSKQDWPILVTSIAHKWLDDGDGLQDRGITRDLTWGVPVRKGDEPWPGMEGKVFYVWFDAPIEYIAAGAEWAEGTGQADSAWRRWWRSDEGAADVRYVQFMGKDNVPFHTLSFPATILGSGEPWKLVDYIKGFNWLNYEGGKFSTSQGRGVFMDQALEVLPESDVWRWNLLSNAPEGSDADFTWSGLQTSVNKDLADVLGNFVSRVTKFAQAKFGAALPEGGAQGPLEAELTEALDKALAAYAAHWEAIEIRKAANELRAIWSLGNDYLQRAAPWSSFKTDPALAAQTVRVGVNLVRLYAILSAPFIPEAAAKMLKALNLPEDTLKDWPKDAAAALTALPAGHVFAVPDNLFRKMEDSERDALVARFSGAGG